MTTQLQPFTTGRQPTRTLSNRLIPYLLIAPPIILVAGLIFFPAIQSVIRTLTPDETTSSGLITFDRYKAFFNDATSVNSLIFTTEITISAVIVLLIIGLIVSLYLRFRKNRLSNFVQGLAVFPLFVPGIILAYALIQFMGPRGTIDNLIRATGTRPLMDAIYHLFGLSGYRTPYLHPEGIVFGVVWESLPFTVLILTAGLGQVDDAVIESARDVGANIFQVFRLIILPLIERPLLIVICLNFIGIFGSYTLPYLLGPAAPQVMGVLMQNTYSQFLAPLEAQTQAVITFLACAIVGLLYIRTIIRQRAGQAKFSS